MIEKKYADFAWEKTAALLAIDSPSGFTDRAAKWVCGEFQQMGFNAYLTAKGGVIVDFGGEAAGNALLLEAHTDTLGGMVAQIKGTGCLKLTNLGGMNANNAEAENVRIYTRSGRVYEGTCQLHDPSIHVNGGYNDTKRSWDSVEVVLDEDVHSAADVRALGCVGDGLTCTERQVSICAKDSGGPYSYGVVGKLIEAAKKTGADYAVDVYPHYGSDVEATLRAGYDIRHGLIGAGVFASHGYERSHIDGVYNTLKVLCGYLDV